MHKEMIPQYVCDFCNKKFKKMYECANHELNEHLCPNCKHSYYVYGCELNCSLTNNHKRCKFQSK